VPGGDDLIEKVRGLLIEGEIPQFVTNEQSGVRVEAEFAHQGMIDLGSQQLIQHVHGGGEEGAHVGLTGSPAENLGKVGFARPRIPDQDHVGACLEEVEVKEPEDAALALQARLVVLEVKGVDSGLSVEAGEVEAPLDGAAVAGCQFEIDQVFQGGGEAKVLGGRFLQGLFQVLAQDRQFQLFELLFEGCHKLPFERRE